MWKIAGLLLLLGCSGSDSTAPPPIEVEGTWGGNFTFPMGSAGTMTMTLRETDGTVTGNGNIVGPLGSNALSIYGTYSEPNVALALSTSGFEDISLSGVVTEAKLSGNLQGSGFKGTPVSLTRR